jgi:hypothetical protein
LMTFVLWDAEACGAARAACDGDAAWRIAARFNAAAGGVTILPR